MAGITQVLERWINSTYLNSLELNLLLDPVWSMRVSWDGLGGTAMMSCILVSIETPNGNPCPCNRLSYPEPVTLSC